VLRPSRLAALLSDVSLNLGQSQLGDLLGEFFQAVMFANP